MTQIDYPDGHALIIGVGDDLANTVNDAHGIADTLADSTKCGYPSEQVHLLTEKEAHKDAIREEFGWFINNLTVDSTFVFYFSGHGYQVGSVDDETYYLIPNGGDFRDLGGTCIRHTQLTKLINRIPAKRKLLLLDCCHAGGFDQAQAKGQQSLELAKAPLPLDKEFIQGEGTVIIGSSRADELSWTGTPYSVFTAALIDAFSGFSVAKKDGYVRVTDLADYTKSEVKRITNKKQHPVLDFMKADNFVVALYAGGGKEPKGKPIAETLKPQEPDTQDQNRGSMVDNRDTTINAQNVVVGQQDIKGGLHFGDFNPPSSNNE